MFRKFVNGFTAIILSMGLRSALKASCTSASDGFFSDMVHSKVKSKGAEPCLPTKIKL